MAGLMKHLCLANQQYKVCISAVAAMPLQSWKSGLHSSTQRCQNAGRDPPPANIKIMYIPNPFKWLHNRLEIATLKKEFDPDFDEENFKFGACQAVCTVTDIANKREWGELRGLLTQSAIDELRKTKWTVDQTHNTVLSSENVQVVQINNINLQVIVADSAQGSLKKPCYKKYCDIDTTVIGTRIPYNLEKHSIIMLEYFSRFHREYTDDKLPEWTITKFRLQNFQAVPRR